MKTKLALLTLALAAMTAPGAESKSTPNATNRFAITGMHCDGCAKGITGELKLTPGVVSVDVSFSNKLATVAFDRNIVSTARLVKVIKEAGYKAELK